MIAADSSSLTALFQGADGRDVELLDEGLHFESDIVDRIRRNIVQGESAWLEFKSTACRNLHTREKDVRIRDAVVKTVSAFLNGDGGTLLVGVGDKGNIVGIEQDYPHIKGGDRDGWERWITDTLVSAIGEPATAQMQIRFATLNGLTVARVDVDRSRKPVYARYGPGKEGVFFARIHNTTRELKSAELPPICNGALADDRTGPTVMWSALRISTTTERSRPTARAPVFWIAHIVVYLLSQSP